jgi:hypothetical protein
LGREAAVSVSDFTCLSGTDERNTNQEACDNPRIWRQSERSVPIPQPVPAQSDSAGKGFVASPRLVSSFEV